MRTPSFRPPSISGQPFLQDPAGIGEALGGPPVICIGTFDGVHRGHQAILERGREIARAKNCPMLAITFEPHPKSVISPGQAPLLLTESAEKIALLRAFGADIVLQLRFDQKLASTSATDFLDVLILKELHAAGLVLGHDFRFGRGREGTPEFLQDWGVIAGIQVDVVQAVIDGNLKERISSSLIRQNLRQGHFDQAIRLLGHSYPVSGEIVTGAGRGRKLGYPTWNLCVSECKLPPPVGIYAGWAGRQKPHSAMAYYGSNPTFGEHAMRVEAHLLVEDSGHGDAPFATAPPEPVETIWLAGYVRPEARFDDADALKRQLAEDERVIRNMLSTSVNLNLQP